MRGVTGVTGDCGQQVLLPKQTTWLKAALAMGARKAVSALKRVKATKRLPKGSACPGVPTLKQTEPRHLQDRLGSLTMGTMMEPRLM